MITVPVNDKALIFLKKFGSKREMYFFLSFHETGTEKPNQTHFSILFPVFAGQFSTSFLINILAAK
jgi:hypothetical protein